MDNFKKFKFDLTPDSFLALIGEDCCLCPAKSWCEEESWTGVPDCAERFRRWAGMEAKDL